MLPIKRRIKKESFKKEMKGAAFLHTEDIYLRLLDRKDNLPSLFSFIIPIKIIKTSVGRHLIKRRLSDIIEKTLTRVKPSYSCFIFLKKDISSLPYIKIKQEILELLTQAGVLNRINI
jgi:ribonuclease P protein component